MTINITSYNGLNAAVSAYTGRSLAGGGNDPILSSRFDDFLALAERRIYYGYATDDPGNPMRSDPLRCPEMQTVDTVFTPGTSGTVAQPTNFLELISVKKNTGTAIQMQIVAERVLDEYGSNAVGNVVLWAVSGTNFRILDAPAATDTFTLRSYQKLTTPTAAVANTILTSYPDVYLYACLTEAAIYTQDSDSALKYLMVYNASVSGLNARRQRITASANPVMRVGGGMKP